MVTNLVSEQTFKCAGNREKTALVCDMLTIQACFMGLIQVLHLLKASFSFGYPIRYQAALVAFSGGKTLV